MPLTNVSCPETKKGCFSLNLDPIFFIKKNKIIQSSGLSKEPCITILSAPSLIACLGDFLASYCISLYLSQHSRSSLENAVITQGIWKCERGRKTEICLPTHTICTLPQINNKVKQIFDLRLHLLIHILFKKGSPNLPDCPCISQSAGSPVICFCLTQSPPAITSHTRLSEKEY